MLPPSQIQISANLTDDNVLIYKTAGSENGRVVVSKFILWINKMIFNSVVWVMLWRITWLEQVGLILEKWFKH